jgi:uncharacterized protein HemX
MRAPTALLSVVIAGCVGGFVGYTVTNRANREEIVRTQHERDLALVREHELRNQLQSALTARATLEEEAQRLQTNLTERLRRLEELAAQLAQQTGQDTSLPPVPREPTQATEEPSTE